MDNAEGDRPGPDVRELAEILILSAGVELGVFETLGDQPAGAAAVAQTVRVETRVLSRLLRALGAPRARHPDAHQRFTLTPLGAVLRHDHPQSLRGLALHAREAATRPAGRPGWVPSRRHGAGRRPSIGS